MDSRRDCILPSSTAVRTVHAHRLNSCPMQRTHQLDMLCIIDWEHTSLELRLMPLPLAPQWVQHRAQPLAHKIDSTVIWRKGRW